MKSICKYCEEQFETDDKPRGWMANHTRWCDKNPNRNNWNKNNTENTIKTSKRKMEERKVLYNENPNKCKKCEQLMPYEKRHYKFCNESCAASFNNLKRKRVKWSEEAKLNVKNKIAREKTITYITFCKNCKKCYKSNKRIYCSNECKNFYRIKDFSDIKIYRSACRFRFSLNDYPNKYDFSLIKKYGWYKAKNYGDNPNGISRDHIISIKFGLTNNIPSWIISHPANCQLLPHSVNNRKKTKCDLSLDELLEKIKKWKMN